MEATTSSSVHNSDIAEGPSTSTGGIVRARNGVKTVRTGFGTCAKRQHEIKELVRKANAAVFAKGAKRRMDFHSEATARMPSRPISRSKMPLLKRDIQQGRATKSTVHSEATALFRDYTGHSEMEQFCHNAEDDEDVELPEHSSEEDVPEDDAASSSDEDLVGMEYPLPTPEEKIYDGCDISVDDYCCLVECFARRYNLSDVCFDALLRLIQTILPVPNCCPPSAFLFKKRLSASPSAPSITTRRYCGSESCLAPLTDNVCGNNKCTYAGKLPRAIPKEVQPSEIAVFDLASQIKRIAEANLELMQSHLEMCSKFGTLVTDFCNSPFYGNLGPNPDSDGTFWLTLFHHIDSTPMSCDGGLSIFPLQCAIAELPPKVRFKVEHAIFLAFSMSPRSKPAWPLLLRSAMSQLHQLRDVPLIIRIGRKTVNVKVRFGALLADLIAKAPALGLKQFNGHGGCPVCYDPGAYNGMSRYYPYNEDIHELRQPEDFITGKGFGMKSRSPFTDFAHHFPAAAPFDDLHLLFEGACKWHLTQLFGDRGSGQEYKVKAAETKVLSEYLLRTQWPSEFRRTVRRIEDFARWKASEMQNYLLYVSLPLLVCHSSLGGDYLAHWYVFVLASRRLLGDVISAENVEQLRFLIKLFREHIPDLFTPFSQTFILHALQHLPEQVEQLGPMTGYSTFYFESVLNKLRSLAHGTRGQLRQVCCNYLREVSCRLQLDDLASGKTGSKPAQALAKRLAFKTTAIPADKLVTTLDDSVHGILPMRKCNLSQAQAAALRRSAICTKDPEGPLKVRHGMVILQTFDKRPGDSVVQFQLETGGRQYGIIQKFVFHERIMYALVQVYEKLEVTLPSLICSQTFYVPPLREAMDKVAAYDDFLIANLSSDVIALRASDILSKAFKLEKVSISNDGKFIVVLNTDGVPILADLTNDDMFDSVAWPFEKRAKASSGALASVMHKGKVAALQVYARGSEEAMRRTYHEKFTEFNTQFCESENEESNRSGTTDNSIGTENESLLIGSNEVEDASEAPPPAKRRVPILEILSETREEMVIRSRLTDKPIKVQEIQTKSSTNKTAKALAVALFGEKYVAKHRMSDGEVNRLNSRGEMMREDVIIFERAMSWLFPEDIGSLPPAAKRESLMKVRTSVTQAGRDMERATPDEALQAFLASKGLHALFDEFKKWRCGKKKFQCAEILANNRKDTQ